MKNVFIAAIFLVDMPLGVFAHGHVLGRSVTAHAMRLSDDPDHRELFPEAIGEGS